jgi:RNA-directed DNA polymerase
MKREPIAVSDIATWHNLALAAWKAARGKRTRPDVVRFMANADCSLARLAWDTLGGRTPYGGYRSFEIHDPKTRLIHAACFEDRVLHHAIMNLAEPVFERALVPSTYACRPKRGVHKAVSEVQRHLQRFPWFGKVDIDGYFPSIDHACLQRLLARRFKGEEFLALLGRIIDSYASQPGKDVGRVTPAIALATPTAGVTRPTNWGFNGRLGRRL